ncbi:hypothetical protein UFOVP585_35 [uncultured Caudovirales phage]|uniref:Uncharacterized protein n=1 Tax=uncultured Caudovirales phage TaxID=2100421 RepID=A0A6J5N356_9CAUD|nr:hypothetical protein UFOVP585_35 [uncultured Caudovirales phage]
MRIKLLADYKEHKADDTIEVSKNEAFGLIDSGKAMISKDMVRSDIKTKEIKRGNTSTIRTHKPSRR